MTNSPIQPLPSAIEDSADRTQLLLAMYKATWDNINRHILVVWQSVAALFTALGASYITAATSVSPDLVASLVIVTAGWAVAVAIDASGWYNRNLLIIANIEKQFLAQQDLKEIHCYFESHRPARPIEFLQIQIILGTSIGVLALMQHFSDRVAPGFRNSFAEFDLRATVPYIVSVVVGVALSRFSNKVTASYEKLKIKSPGLEVGEMSVLSRPATQ